MAKKRKSPRARRSIRGLNKKDITGLAMSAAVGGVGAVLVGKVLESVLPAQYAQYSHYVNIAAGIGLASMSKNNYLQSAGMGAAVVGASKVVADLTDGVNGIGLLSPGRPQYQVTGLPGAAENIVMS